jgi:hypothetical protein
VNLVETERAEIGEERLIMEGTIPVNRERKNGGFECLASNGKNELTWNKLGRRGIR